MVKSTVFNAMLQNTDSLPVIQLMGPTASGKTALALALAQRFALEIISVDSALIYRGMDIGTAKPSRTERLQTPHHLIDIRDPHESYSAAEFVQDAQVLIDEIRVRNKIPLLVGGTMLYFKAFNEGLNDLPGANAEVRARLDAEAAQHGWPSLHLRLQEIDPKTAGRLAPSDAQRIQRALEVYELSGQPMSTLYETQKPQARVPHGLTIALLPDDRGALHKRIAQRFDAMLAAGFLEEVAQLRARGDLHEHLPSMRAVGYRQAWTYLEKPDGHLDTFREQAIAATRQLAKRQMTWLRSLPADFRIHTLPNALGTALQHERLIFEAVERAVEQYKTH